MNGPILEVEHLVKEFPGGRRGEVVRAVDDVSFAVAEGEVLGLVGESGSGKSTTARCVMRLIEPTSGRITFEGNDLMDASRSRLKRLRRGMQMVFQDPYSSLDPRMRIEDVIAEGMVVHGTVRGAEARRARVAELLELVGLRQDHLRRRPSDFSGGERQRIGIARALAVDPRLLVCDEPVASLDVSIQAQILNLFKRLQRDLGLTIIFIAHDLATVRHLCDRVAVMSNGAIHEIGTREQIYSAPTSDYTRSLLAAMPVPDPEVERRKAAARRARLEPAGSAGEAGGGDAPTDGGGPTAADPRPSLPVSASGGAG
ncbi:ATP-binding cassette domain-containing protein [Geodermatophilus sp. YIM 151500]|uniref:ATP-binding cassette domain-containing protein n=1 Tax=Geodermatophilus sp. YIM 151500 TaxID=2984531 RepID=UPI0021E39715|nr:ATP-binding cassette domain-containing protein [Geodermatophilus sp. YIM 151500]MCV2489292.1 ATP-binding cassette domain-containing protein [Geodermatophilus sp. YIM 151500]